MPDYDNNLYGLVINCDDKSSCCVPKIVIVVLTVKQEMMVAMTGNPTWHCSNVGKSLLWHCTK